MFVYNISNHFALSPESQKRVLKFAFLGQKPGVLRQKTGMEKQSSDMQASVPDSSITITLGYAPGVLGRCLDMHMRYYSRFSGFGKIFELDLAAGIENLLRRIDHPFNEAFIAMDGSEIVGTLFIDGTQETVVINEDTHMVAKLRAFIVDGRYHRQGIGRMLMEKAMNFVDERKFAETRLWTFKGLDGARLLYDRAGFVLTQEQLGSRWGEEVTEQLFVRTKRQSIAT